MEGLQRRVGGCTFVHNLWLPRGLEQKSISGAHYLVRPYMTEKWSYCCQQKVWTPSPGRRNMTVMVIFRENTHARACTHNLSTLMERRNDLSAPILEEFTFRNFCSNLSVVIADSIIYVFHVYQTGKKQYKQYVCCHRHCRRCPSKLFVFNNLNYLWDCILYVK